MLVNKIVVLEAVEPGKGLFRRRVNPGVFQGMSYLEIDVRFIVAIFATMQP